VIIFLKKIDLEFKDELDTLEKKKNKLKEEKEKMEETLRYLDLYLIPKPVYSYQDELNYEKYLLDQKAKNKVKRQMEKIKDTDQKQYDKYYEEQGNRLFQKIKFVKEGESKISDSKKR